MKALNTIVKILTALAAVAGAVYIIATYGEQIVAWAKKILNSLPKCPKCEEAEEDAEIEVEITVEEPAAEETISKEIESTETVPEETVTEEVTNETVTDESE